MKTCIVACWTIAVLLGLWTPMPSAAAERSQPAAQRNVTFLSTSDCHYKESDSKTSHNSLNRTSVEAMNAIATLGWPDKLGGDPICRPVLGKKLI